MNLGRCALALLVAGLACAAGARPAAAAPAPDPPLDLPAVGASAAAAEPATWIVGAAPGGATARIARAHAAQPLLLEGAYTVPRARARGFAAALRDAGRLRFAEPNRPVRRTAAPDANPDGWARGAVTRGPLTLPAMGPVGVADSVPDTSHPDLAGHITLLNPGGPIEVAHGTQVASVAAGAANGSGVTGIVPGAPVISWGMPGEFGCSDTVNAIRALTRAKVKAINASFGSTEVCYAEYAAVVRAFAAGTLVVAASGNEFHEGNPLEYPAALPHVLSVAALTPELGSADFSNASLAVDVAAPGVAVPAATPPALDTEDGAQDGVSAVDGTSFAAPMATAVVAAVAANRPTWSIGQVADAIRFSARDVWKEGYDTDTGFGLIDLAGALAIDEPAFDPLEPNDTIAEVNGRVFATADTPVWRGSGRRTIYAKADTVEDPTDVYRARIPAKAAFTIRLRPLARNHDPDLYVYERRAKSLREQRTRIDSSVRGAGRTDSVSLVNRAGDARVIYVAVTVPTEAKFSNADYALEFVRRRRR